MQALLMRGPFWAADLTAIKRGPVLQSKGAKTPIRWSSHGGLQDQHFLPLVSDLAVSVPPQTTGSLPKELGGRWREEGPKQAEGGLNCISMH